MDYEVFLVSRIRESYVGTQADIEQARQDWMTGSRFGEVKGYDGDPPLAPELQPLPLKPRGRVGADPTVPG